MASQQPYRAVVFAGSGVLLMLSGAATRFSNLVGCVSLKCVLANQQLCRAVVLVGNGVLLSDRGTLTPNKHEEFSWLDKNKRESPVVDAAVAPASSAF